MTDLNSALTGALRTAADEDDVHVERLLAGARRSGVRYRRRRRLAMSTCGAALSVALAAGGLAVVRPLWAARSDTGPSVAGSPALRSSAPSTPAPAQSPTSMTEMPQLPEAPGATTVLQAPAEVGRNPLLVHVTLAKLSRPARMVQFISGDGRESLSVDGVAVQVSRNAADLDPLHGTRHDVTVNGRAAVVAVETAGGSPMATVRWQPVAGLWAQVSGGLDQAAALAMAADVRFDRVYRCAVPFRLTNAPAGTKVTTCNISFLGATVQATATVRIGTWYVTAGAVPGTVSDSTETLGGKPAHVVEHAGDGGARIMEVRVDEGGQVGDFTAEGPYDAATVRNLAAGFVPTGGDRPADWPVSPLG